jgi:hypothetical protein
MTKKVRTGRRKIINKKSGLHERFIIIAALASAAVVFFFLLLIKWNGNVLHVAYYRLPPPVTDSLTKQIRKGYAGKTRFTVLAPGTVLSRRKARRYDLLFTWNGAEADILAEKAAVIPAQLYAQIPSSERKLGSINGTNRMLPLLYDHYELSFLRRTIQKTGNVPETWDSFTHYLTNTAADVQVPLFTAGADNRTLLAFVGALAESLTGPEGYARLAALLQNAPSLDAVVNKPFGRTGSAETPVSIRYILDLIVSWQNAGLTHKTWFNGSEADVASFMKDSITAAVFMPLSEHRTLPLSTLHQYESSHFPADTAVSKHALIAPAVMLIAYGKNPRFSDTVRFLISVPAQETLSTDTRLAPASSQAEAYDRQADDVRYWAASYAGGPVPDLANAAFTSSRKADKIAGEIRNYLGK